jgi:HK97 family phage prohead protease
LESDNIGLRYEINIPDTTTGNDLLVSIERGDVRHSSFAFAVASDGVSWEEDKNEGDVRVVKKVKYLFDVSPVGDPAYAQSTVEVAQRSHEEWLKSKNENKPVSRTWETDRMKREIEMYN